MIVTGDLSFPGMDCAEEFDVDDTDAAEPGTLMSLGDDGALVPSRAEYERRVVGIVAGAGDFRPGIVLGRDPQRPADGRRRPIALVGRAYCKAVVTDEAIEVGDLLTSSAVPGHAMRAADPGRAFGAVIGKAMAPLRSGSGLVPVLISLQ
ncbi:hypothetical protein [Microbacterium terricola]|uniref:Uncharacterized protein n=1 Tax=Microbacterium terricola TaxID=344163 RepID=A0ABM8E0S8_9MICO|nr:hypothetical protein [Microbacterium terricola]UYK40823.1 hypothetical protein OAU46_04015 [Microbacterium terricola]BDV31429.1 hypothetical protein Microterr_20890 [Microbacterium terricola]